MKARNKERLKIAIWAIILVVYITGFVIIFNYKTIFGIGYYHDEKDFSTTYSGGNGGVNLKIYALHIGGSDGNVHYYGIEITAFSSPDSHLEGITYLDYQIATTVPKQVFALNYSVPITTYSIGYVPRLETRLFQHNNLTCQGYADIRFKVNDVDELHRVPFDIGIIIKLNGAAINYDFGNISTWVNVIYLGCTAIPLAFFFRSIRSLRFMRWYTEEMRKADEEFRRELSLKKESLSK
ncbi:MAG: hypothetical protein HWN79_16785 [Candidatus Lokiarchaeota archaeon]|nr:hypothetical protein [Candidatus Lokiarchaeota archaeon]